MFIIPLKKCLTQQNVNLNKIIELSIYFWIVSLAEVLPLNLNIKDK